MATAIATTACDRQGPFGAPSSFHGSGWASPPPLHRKRTAATIVHWSFAVVGLPGSRSTRQTAREVTPRVKTPSAVPRVDGSLHPPVSRRHAGSAAELDCLARGHRGDRAVCACTAISSRRDDQHPDPRSGSCPLPTGLRCFPGRSERGPTGPRASLVLHRCQRPGSAGDAYPRFGRRGMARPQGRPYRVAARGRLRSPCPSRGPRRCPGPTRRLIDRPSPDLSDSGYTTCTPFPGSSSVSPFS